MLFSQEAFFLSFSLSSSLVLAFHTHKNGFVLMMMFDVCRCINRNDLLEYIGTHYKGPRMVLAAAGGKNLLSCAVQCYCVQSVGCWSSSCRYLMGATWPSGDWKLKSITWKSCQTAFPWFKTNCGGFFLVVTRLIAEKRKSLFFVWNSGTPCSHWMFLHQSHVSV